MGLGRCHSQGDADKAPSAPMLQTMSDEIVGSQGANPLVHL